MAPIKSFPLFFSFLFFKKSIIFGLFYFEALLLSHPPLSLAPFSDSLVAWPQLEGHVEKGREGSGSTNIPPPFVEAPPWKQRKKRALTWFSSSHTSSKCGSRPCERTREGRKEGRLQQPRLDSRLDLTHPSSNGLVRLVATNPAGVDLIKCLKLSMGTLGPEIASIDKLVFDQLGDLNRIG